MKLILNTLPFGVRGYLQIECCRLKNFSIDTPLYYRDYFKCQKNIVIFHNHPIQILRSKLWNGHSKALNGHSKALNQDIKDFELKFQLCLLYVVYICLWWVEKPALPVANALSSKADWGGRGSLSATSYLRHNIAVK